MSGIARQAVSPIKTVRNLETFGWLELGRGKVISKEDIENSPGEYPVYSSAFTDDGFFGKYGEYLFSDERVSWSIDGGGMPFYRHKHRYSLTNVSGWMRVVNKSALNTRYLYYAVFNEWYRNSFDYALKAHPSVIRDLYAIPLPTLEIQQRIADYLDRETAEIDAAVADLDRYVKLLEKRGKVLIEKTVIGGTNSFSPLWSKIRVQNGFAFDSEKFSPTKELPVAKIGNVLPGDFSEFIDASELPSESFLIKDGDLVVGMSGDFNRTIWNKGKAALNQRVCILKPIADDDIRYINYAIGSGLKKIHSTKFSTTLKNLSTEEILAIRVPHRTVTEQKEIATYLDKETAEINDLVVESTRLRDLLLKRRSVLITEVVTGRKQV